MRLYIAEDGTLEQVKYKRKLHESSEFLPEVFLNLTDYITVPFHIVHLAKQQEVQSYIDDSIGDTSLVPHSALRPFV